jgi:uncharacterized protein YndB with AHSA1/START domain
MGEKNKEPPEKMLVITRYLDAPRELVYKEWTEPKRMMRWWGPRGFTTPVCKMDLRPGGIIHYCMRSPEGKDYWGKGTFREIVKSKRLSFTDIFSDEDGNDVKPQDYGMSPDWPEETVITVTFEEEDNKTKLTMQQTVLESIAERSGAMQGWEETLDRLEEDLQNHS